MTAQPTLRKLASLVGVEKRTPSRLKPIARHHFQTGDRVMANERRRPLMTRTVPAPYGLSFVSRVISPLHRLDELQAQERSKMEMGLEIRKIRTSLWGKTFSNIPASPT